jgi:hypothetical protein
VKKYQLVSLLWLVSSIHGQNLVDIRTQTKDVNFSGAASTIPAKSGTALPATCNPGEMFFNTANSPGQNLYTCAPANTWTQLSSSTNGTVSTASQGQFGYYAAPGTAITGHTLVAGDIPSLSYQTPLTFTGSGAKTASATGTMVNNDCAKWDPNGNIIDAGAPCAAVASGAAGQFGFYSISGNALTAHTLAAGDIPALNYQTPLTFTGNGVKTASSTGSFAASDCVKWDSNGNLIDAGSPCNSWAALSSGTNTTGALVVGSGSSLNPGGTGIITANNIPVITNYANCPITAGAVAYLTTEFGICGGNGSNFWFSTYWNGNSTAPTINHFVIWGSSTTPGQQIDSGYSASGTGTGVVTTSGTHTSGDCAKWDANGNVIDAGSPCGSGSSSPTFSALSSSTNTSAAMLVGTGASLGVTGSGTISATAVPVTGVTGLTFSGNTAKAASSTGTLTSSDCAKWDPNGNIIDAGSPCASVASGTTGQFAFYSVAGSALTAHTLAAADIPALTYQAPLSFTGSGTKTITSTGAGASGNCAKWDANGNVVDAGAACGSGSGSGSLSVPSSTTVGNVPQYSNTTGTAVSTGLGVVTAVGTPGLDTNVPTEKSVRTAIAAASAAAGNLPALSGSAGYLITNGTSSSWGDLVTGSSGALCAGTGCSGGTAGTIDIVTSVIPRLASANTFTGLNKFQQLQVTIYTVATLPTCSSSFEGQMEGVSDAVSPSYLATVTGGGSVHTPVYCNGTAWVAH